MIQFLSCNKRLSGVKSAISKMIPWRKNMKFAPSFKKPGSVNLIIIMIIMLLIFTLEFQTFS